MNMCKKKPRSCISTQHNESNLEAVIYIKANGEKRS